MRDSEPVIGTLSTLPAREHPELLAPPVVAGLETFPERDVLVAEIDPTLADTTAFCERYEVPLEQSANCVVVAGRRGDRTTLAACVVLATTRADVNGMVRRRLDARKASFAPMELVVAETGMEFGGITPIGLPAGWPVYVDARVVAAGNVIVGSGVRRSKLVLPGASLGRLAAAEVLDSLAF
jgi:prolyl-tRNA editing enzyme YbaK/EbsC (Cys-tRNA(Pro) deacylase)